MKKYLLLIFILTASYTTVLAVDKVKLSGLVLEGNRIPLVGATVVLHPQKLVSITDKEGRYLFENLDKGRYRMTVSYIGYHTEDEQIGIKSDMIHHVQMKDEAVHLHEVVVKDIYAHKIKKEQSLAVEYVNEDYLKQNLGGSLMQSLERLGGVSSIGIGSGQSKPVIRGLSFNRVAVIENNIKHQAQEWGVDHGLEIDQYAVDNVVLVKGPASLVYGSDAIGGVVDMHTRSVPRPHTFGGSLDLTGKSNNQSVAGSLKLQGRAQHWFATLRASAVDYSDYRIPADFVFIQTLQAKLHKQKARNTAGNERNLHGSVGYLNGSFQTKLFASIVQSESGFFANAHGLEPVLVDTKLHDKSDRDILFPRQNSKHTKLVSNTVYFWEHNRLEFDLGYQHNLRQEETIYEGHGYMPALFPEKLGFSENLDREFDKQVLSAKSNLSYELSQVWKLKSGLDAEYQDNKISGHGFIIPEFMQWRIGGHAFTQYELTPHHQVQAGLRYDYGSVAIKEYRDWFSSPLTEAPNSPRERLVRAPALERNFSSVTWALGYNTQLEHWTVKFNLGKSFRMPIAKELGANGVNYHRFSFEVGNPNLKPEEAFQFDLSAEYNGEKFAIGISPFLNYFQNYIYLNPTAQFDRLYGNGNQRFEYKQAEVLRYGAELHFHYEFTDEFQFGTIGEYLYAEQLSGAKKGFTLPFAPPAKAVFNLKYEKKRLYALQNLYVSVDYELVASQTNIVPPEVETPSYSVWNLSTGSKIKLVGVPTKIALQVRNLLDTKYFNHTSFYRLINLPQQGRDVILNLQFQF